MMLQIICPDRSEKIAVTWVEFNTPVGNFIIQEGHISTILTLVDEMPCTVALSDGTSRALDPKQATVHITPEQITIFAQSIQ